MLQCFDHIILRLAYGDIFRDQTSYLVPTQDDFLSLVGFFFAHNGGHHLWRELSICEELSHTNGLIVGRGALVQVDLIDHRPLTVLVQIGQLHRRAHLNFPLVHKVEQFRHKVCQADIAMNLISAIAGFFCYGFRASIKLRPHWGQS